MRQYILCIHKNMIKRYDKKWWKTLVVKIFAIYPESDLNTVLSLCVLITQSLPHSSIPDYFSLLLHWSQTLPLCFPLALQELVASGKLKLWLPAFVCVVWWGIRWWLGGQGLKPMQMLWAEKMLKEFWNLSQVWLPLCPNFHAPTILHIAQLLHPESEAEAGRAAPLIM